MPARTPSTTQQLLSPARILGIVMIYAVFGALWILLSDKAMELLFPPDALVMASIFKGWFFILITSLLLYTLMRRLAGSSGPAPLKLRRLLGLPFALLALAIITLTVIGVLQIFASQRATEVLRMQTIADLKVQQVTSWLDERRQDAEFIASSDYYRQLYRQWQNQGDQTSGRLLQERLARFIREQGFKDISIVKTTGEVVWSHLETAHHLDPPLKAGASGSPGQQVQRIGPYLDRSGEIHLHYLLPLAGDATGETSLILHADPESWLFPTLQEWPLPSATGDTVLFRRDGEHVQFLNDQRHLPGLPLQLRIPLSNRERIAAQALRGEVREGEMVEGTDYRDQPVTGVARAIPGTDWMLLVKEDNGEIYAKAADAAAWILLAGLLALFITGAGLIILRQRQQLALAVATHQAESERLQALNLLDAIAASSEDAIFAKDLQGRYLLFNAAAGRFAGKPAEQVLGQDDRAISPPEQAEMLMEIGRRVVANGRLENNEERLDTALGPRVFLATKGPLFNDQGEVFGTFGISRDITRRKEDEEALRERLQLQEQLASIAMSVPGLICSFRLRPDGTAHMPFTTPAVEDLFGLSQENLAAGMADWTAHVPPEDLLHINQTVERSAADFSPWHCRYRYQHPFKGLRWIEGWSIPKQVEDGCIEWHGFVMDVTEAMEAEQALRASEGRFRALVEQSLAGIYIIQDGHFRYVNAAFATIFGYDSPQQLVDRIPVERLVSEEDRERVAENVRRRVEGELNDIYYTFTGIRQDGQSIDVEVHGRAFEFQGRPAVIGLTLDISGRRRAEAALRQQTYELLERNRELERFNQASVDRELAMIELKQQINRLSERLGEAPPYPLEFIQEPSTSGDEK